MEYFTLSEDLEKVRKSKSKLKTLMVTVSIVFISIFVLRSFDAITVEYNRANFQGNHTVNKEIYKLHNEGKNYETDKNTLTIQTDDKDSNWNLGIRFSLFFGDERKSADKYLENLIKNKIAKENNLKTQFESSVVSIKKLEMSGLYWTPLIKNGKSSYRIFVGNKVFDNSYSADFSGEIILQVYGFCTIDKLEKIVAEKIAKVVVESIKKDYKK